MRLTEDEEVLEVLRGYFDDDQIEERLGGTLDLSTPEVTCKARVHSQQLCGAGTTHAVHLRDTSL